MSKLFLDDIRFPEDVWRNTIDPDYQFDHDWIIVRSYDAFVSHMKENELPGLISFDHDLSYDHYMEENQSQIDYSSLAEKTGYHAAQWLIEYCNERMLQLPCCKVHSMNLSGKNNIIALLEKANQQT